MKMKHMSEDKSPLDEMIDQVQAYIDDPKLVTPETLKDLQNQLFDLKEVLDTDEDVEEDEPYRKRDKDNSSAFIITIGKKRGQE